MSYASQHQFCLFTRRNSDVSSTKPPPPSRSESLVERVAQFTGPRAVEVAEQQSAPPPSGHLRVRTRFSGISAGTELTAHRGTNPYLTRTWDPEARLFREGAADIAYPVTGWGYSEVGEVTEVSPELAVVDEIDSYHVASPPAGAGGLPDGLRPPPPCGARIAPGNFLLRCRPPARRTSVLERTLHASGHSSQASTPTRGSLRAVGGRPRTAHGRSGLARSTRLSTLSGTECSEGPSVDCRLSPEVAQ